jgi:putative ABC transport system ATP-binding protein
MSGVLELERLSRTFGAGVTEVQALVEVDLHVADRELVAIMGPSGSGKSTLLALAGGLDTATSGQVRVAGRDLTGLSRRERSAMRRRTIGYVFQELNLLSSLTAAENVALPLELDGRSARAARKDAVAVLAGMGLEAEVDRFPDDLSGGQRQRVAIARALVGDRQLLLADEPTGALDSVSGETVMQALRAACDGGSAAILVTHDAKLAAWADRVVFLRDGRVVDATNPPAGPESVLEASPVR